MRREGTHTIDQRIKFTRSNVNGFQLRYQNSLSYELSLVSIVAPCYNKEENIALFLKAVTELDLNPYRYEVIIVNDGSRDRSGMILKEMKDTYPFLRVIHFSRNFGQQQALMAGIRKARGEVLVTLDLDLQQPPALIPDMIRLYEKGYQVVHAIPRYQNDSATWIKKLTSKLYYKWIRWMGLEGVVYKSNDFRLFSHRVATVLRALPERNLYIRGILAWLCPLVASEDDNPVETQDHAAHVKTHDFASLLWVATIISYRHRPREHGETKYTWSKMIRLALDGLTATSIRPLRFGLFLGGGSIILALGLSIWALYMHLVAGQTVSGWTSLMIVVLFFSSMQFILLGLVGEYIGKIFLQVRGRQGSIPLGDNSEEPSSTHFTVSKRNYKNKSPEKRIKILKGRNPESNIPKETRHPP